MLNEWLMEVENECKTKRTSQYRYKIFIHVKMNLMYIGYGKNEFKQFKCWVIVYN